MSVLSFVRCLHVLFAVLGTGTVAALPISARAASRPGAAIGAELLISLARWASIGLALVFVTGGALDVLSHGEFHEHWWFRLAGLSMLATGVILGRMRSLLRSIERADEKNAALARTSRFAYASCALVGWLVILMELRPFG